MVGTLEHVPIWIRKVAGVKWLGSTCKTLERPGRAGMTSMPCLATTFVAVTRERQPQMWSCRREGNHKCGRVEESATTFVVKISCKPLISPVCEGIFLLSNHICGCSKEETTTFVVEARKRQPQMWLCRYKDGHKCGRQKRGLPPLWPYKGERCSLFLSLLLLRLRMGETVGGRKRGHHHARRVDALEEELNHP